MDPSSVHDTASGASADSEQLRRECFAVKRTSENMQTTVSRDIAGLEAMLGYAITEGTQLRLPLFVSCCASPGWHCRKKKRSRAGARSMHIYKCNDYRREFGIADRSFA